MNSSHGAIRRIVWLGLLVSSRLGGELQRSRRCSSKAGMRFMHLKLRLSDAQQSIRSRRLVPRDSFGS